MQVQSLGQDPLEKETHRSVQLQLLQRYWLGHRLGLLWYWMVCLGNEQRSFCRFWDCIGAVKFKWSHSFGCKTCFLYLVQNSNYHLLTITCSLTLNKYLESIIFSWCLLLLSCNYSSWVLSVLHQNYFIRNNLILHLFFRVWILTICRRYWICLTHLIFQ